MISKSFSVVFSFVLVLLFVSTAQAQSSSPLVQSGNLKYLGSFKLPTVSGNGFSYGGGALAFNPANNSLFISGHVYDNYSAEVKIPALGGTATILQGLTDATGGKIGSIGSGSIYLGGQLVYNNKLYLSAFLFYDGSGVQTLSHFSRSLTLNSGSATGPYRVGSMGAGYYSGYMGLVPAEWQAKFGGPAITGNCCLSIISRTSYGPAAFSFNPESSSTSAQPLVYYTGDHQTLGEYGASGKHPMFNGTTRITGVVFPEGTASVLFFGSTGIGNYCYGEGASCGDPSNSSKGEHAYPYRAYVWAYNANDLAAVKAGSKQPWSVTPYATWELSQLGDVGGDFSTGGAAYDPATKRIYISKKYGDGDKPVIYVYEVDNAGVSEPSSGPATPTTCTSFSYSAWGVCQSSNTQTRTVTSSSPSGCTGGSPVTSQSCTYTPPTSTCTSFNYSAWGTCQSNSTQTRTVTSQSPSGCTGGSPVTSRSCTYTPPTSSCTSFTYSAWGTCQSNNTQTRTVTSQSPSGCTGGAPVLSQSCVYASPTPSSVPALDGYTLTFNDEFDGTTLDTAKWLNPTNDNSCNGYNEQKVAADDSYLDGNGHLVVRAQSRSSGGCGSKNLTAGQISTKGRFSQAYGRFEFRAQMPEGGGGVWPALWLYPIGVQWPPEIDVLESISDMSTAHMTYHWSSSNQQSGGTYSNPSLATGYHTYVVDWEPGKIVWYIDGVQRYSFTGSDVTSTPMGILIDIYLGGWAGSVTAKFPQYMYVDYVRVYKKTTQTTTTDTTAPSVSLVTPTANATLSGSTVLVSATASDNKGVAGVQFKLDGANLDTEKTTSPYTLLWDTTKTTNGSHTLTAVARDSAGNQKTSSAVTVAVNNTLSDTQAPSVPSGLSATTVSSSQVRLSWSPSTDTVGVTGYAVYRGGTQVGKTTTTTYVDEGLAPGTTYSYAVSAYDAAGNSSAKSSGSSAQTTDVPVVDTQNPSVPSGLNASAPSSSKVDLSWTASTDNVGVAGYKIYQNGSQIGTVTGNTYTSTGLTASTLYKYTVAAYDAAGNASAQSGSVSVTTQTSATVSGFAVGTRVQATSRLNVRKQTSFQWSNVSCVQAKGAYGTLLEGPTTASGYTWWKVQYDDGCVGWSVQNFLDLITTTSLLSVPVVNDLALGSSGAEVSALQTMLKRLGIFTADVTGYFGVITQSAVATLQTATALEAVGSVGPKTREVLKSLLGF
jgi:beta-glucanase (GH16 family)/chitodextrinase